jgi:NAD(P)H-hydrate repair Nnr-like enzyme with NAD(P)H-hydrate dehydratase domain
MVIFINPPKPGMQRGTGDVLTGNIAGLIAQNVIR